MKRSRPITFLAIGAVVLLVAMGVAACGGSNGTSSNAPPASAQKQSPTVATPLAQKPPAKPAKKAAPAPKPAPPPAAPAPAPTQSSSGIPQDNGGDHDADNNGGPDDGDGGI